MGGTFSALHSSLLRNLNKDGEYEKSKRVKSVNRRDVVQNCFYLAVSEVQRQEPLEHLCRADVVSLVQVLRGEHVDDRRELELDGDRVGLLVLPRVEVLVGVGALAVTENGNDI